MNTEKSFWVALVITTLSALMHVPAIYGLNFIDPSILAVLRWVSVVVLGVYGYQKRSLTTWILISMAIGLVVGYDFKGFSANLDVFSKIFIQLIKTVIAPLLLSTLVVGIAGQSNAQSVGRMSAKAFTYFILATTVALAIGLLAINISKAGANLSVQTKGSSAVEMPVASLTASVDSVEGSYKLSYHGKALNPPKPKDKQDWKQVVLHIFPENVAKMIAEGAVLQIVVFSLIFGFALRQVQEPHRLVMLGWLETLGEIMFKFTNIIMYFAPFAVGGAMAYTIGTMGIAVVGNLVKLLLTLYAALFVFIIVVFLPVMWYFRIPIRKFFQAVYEPVSLAFATASSEAAFPKAMTAMENFGVPRKIVAFVLPTGYSFNLDGSTLYLSLASVFCAQAAGMELSMGTQLALMGTLLLTSKGVAGVPRASLVILAGTVNQFNIPEWPIAVILGIDALMDMARTGVNLMGNCLASAVVARWEGELDDAKAHQNLS